jgi:hypothetical protein
MFDLYDLFQNFKIDTTNNRVTDVKYTADINKVSIESLQTQVDHLSLVCQAMCEMMENIGFSKAMLASKIKEIDLRDGKLDGKFVPKKTCNKCYREVAARHVKCLYCGTAV